jgi:hypothetical protein
MFSGMEATWLLQWNVIDDTQLQGSSPQHILESTRDFAADCFIATTVCRTWVIMAWRRQSS